MHKYAYIATMVGLLATAGIASAKTDKVMLCHHTGSATNPVVMISVAGSAVAQHIANHGDIIPAEGATECPPAGDPGDV